MEQVNVTLTETIRVLLEERKFNTLRDILTTMKPYDIAAIFDADGVNIRAGNHCAQPLLDHLGTGATARMSLAFYNTVADVERFLTSLSTIRERMGYGR